MHTAPGFSMVIRQLVSINGTTTFQCIVLSTPTTDSTSGTVTVINGMYEA